MGLRSTGYFGDFCYPKSAKKGSVESKEAQRGGVGFIIHRRHLQNRQADIKEMRTKDRRGYAIRIRLHDGKIWTFASFYGEPGFTATEKREAVAALNEWGLEIRDLCAANGWPLILMGDMNSIYDSDADVWGSTRLAHHEGPVRHFIDNGYIDAFRARGKHWKGVHIREHCGT